MVPGIQPEVPQHERETVPEVQPLEQRGILVSRRRRLEVGLQHRMDIHFPDPGILVEMGRERASGPGIDQQERAAAVVVGKAGKGLVRSDGRARLAKGQARQEGRII